MNLANWAPTDTNQVTYHAFTDGHAICNRRIRPSLIHRMWTGEGTGMHTREDVENMAAIATLCPRCLTKTETIAQTADTTPAAYAARRAVRRTTGHYRKPGTGRSYCGRDLDHTPTPAGKFRAICRACVKAAALDRAAAVAIADQHRTTPDALAEWRDSLTYGSTVYDPARRQTAMVINPRKTVRLPEGGAVRGAIVEFPDGYVLRMPLADLRPIPTVTDADRAAADVEAQQAAALVTEAEATAGTWRGAWIGERTDTATPALFDVEPDAEQGALFA